jgi:hypothetical protein
MPKRDEEERVIEAAVEWFNGTDPRRLVKLGYAVAAYLKAKDKREGS